MARRHANALSTKAAQIRMALRHHGRNFAVIRHAVCPHTRSNDIARYRQSSCSQATRRVCASVFRAPQWHSATRTHFPPRPRKSAWRCNIADITRHTVCPHTRSNPIARYRQSSRSPATRRVYTRMFRAPQWRGATQTHFPPRPRKSAWHCDIANAKFAARSAHKQSYHTIPPISTNVVRATALRSWTQKCVLLV